MNIIRRLLTNTSACSAWDPPGGGRDTHICMMFWRHKGDHRCKCGTEWPR